MERTVSRVRPNTFFGLGRFARKRPDYALGLYTLAGFQAAPAGAGHAHDPDVHAEEQVARYDRLGADCELYRRSDDTTIYASAAYGHDFERAFVAGFVGYDQLVGRKIFLTARPWTASGSPRRTSIRTWT